MNEEYYVGQIFDGVYPPDAAVWCNANNKRIVELETEDGVRRYQIQVVPEPTVDEKKAAVRGVRDGYINDIEWRVSRYRDQVEIGISPTDDAQTYHKILEYMQYLRDYPESSETWYENNPLTFDEWLEQGE